jgi:hypothetical protein
VALNGRHRLHRRFARALPESLHYRRNTKHAAVAATIPRLLWLGEPWPLLLRRFLLLLVDHLLALAVSHQVLGLDLRKGAQCG